MKKLYIGFIFLGFLAFGVQIALADLIKSTEYSPEEIRKKNKSIIESALCLYDKKLNLPQEYTDGNLKIQRIPNNFSYEGFYSNYRPILVPNFEYITDANIKAEDLCNIVHDCKQMQSISIYDAMHGSMRKKDPIIKEKQIKEYFVKSYIINCREYISVFTDSRRRKGGKYGYDVTDVPPGSFLKYIPETKEIQIIPPKDKSYQKNIDDNIYIVKQKLSEIKKEEVKNILLYIGIPLCIAVLMILVAIFGKEILTKFRR